MTLLERSAAVRHRALLRAGGVTVVYVRGAETIDTAQAVPAKVQTTDYGVEEIELTGRERDWLFSTSDLVLRGEPIMPQRGDAILWTDAAGTQHKYEVLPRAGERCYRHCDQTLTQLRVFTIEVAA